MDSKHASEVLESLGFGGLKFINSEGTTFTFKYTTDDPKKLKKLGQPTVASAGKVAVFKVPEVGRLGIATGNSMLRLIADHVTEKPRTNDDHLAGLKVPPAFSKAYEQAKVSPTKRVPFLKKLWEYFNIHKFGGKMHEPRLYTSKAHPQGTSATTRGCYTPMWLKQPSSIWMAEFMFNAREPFFLEIFLHEMCHQATREIDKSTDRSEAGHGPHWQVWMRRVGLDPRRFDPTDNIEYLDSKQAKISEVENASRWGKQRDEAFFRTLRPAPPRYQGPCILRYKKFYALEGVLEHDLSYVDDGGGQNTIYKFTFAHKDSKKRYTLSLSAKDLKDKVFLK